MKSIMSNKKFYISVAILIVTVILAAVFGYVYMSQGSSVSVARAESARSTPDGIEVVSDTKTMYYLDIPCKGVSGYLDFYPNDYHDAVCGQLNKQYDAIAAAKTPVTFIFVFNKVLVNNRPLLATWNLPIEYYHKSDNGGAISKWAYRNDGKVVSLAKITFADNARINIRKEYYERFKDADFSDVSITHLYNGRGYIMYNEHTADLGFSDKWFDYNNSDVLYYSFDGVQVRDETVPEDYDPIVEEGQAPDNGGVVDSPVETLEQKLGLDGDGWKWWQILLACVGVVVGIIFLPWIVKLLIWLIKLPIKLIAWIIGSVKK